MALVNCKECGTQISSKAVTCPHCGAKPPKRTSLLTWVVGGLFAFGIISAINGKMDRDTELQRQESAESARLAAMTPEQHAAAEEAKRNAAALKEKNDRAVQRATAGALLLKKAMRNPDSFKLESASVIDGTGAVCYDYRAQNGFGGVNVGHAVLAGESNRFLTSEMPEFAQMWNKECARKSVMVDAAAAIRMFAL